MADLIVEKADSVALAIMAKEARSCAFGGNSKLRREPAQLAMAVAREKIEIGKVETEHSLQVLKALVSAMSHAPGRRMIVLASPGFFVPDRQKQTEIMDLAARSDVTVNTLDPRALIPSVEDDPRKAVYHTSAEIEDAEILRGLADATGGVFFHNSNDVAEGFRRTAAAPEYSYTLAFSPENLKPDGHFHQVKVKVKTGEKLTVQARKGYYAPKEKP